MTHQVLDALQLDQDTYRCMRCEAELGPVGADWRKAAVSFDEPITAGEPQSLDSGADRFVLRHFCCPTCATLFEVQMLPVDHADGAVR